MSDKIVNYYRIEKAIGYLSESFTDQPDTGSDIGNWLNTFNTEAVLIVGFYTHGCVSTTAREAIMRDLHVLLDPHATGACAIMHASLGALTAEEVRSSALLQLMQMGATIV